MDAFFDAASGRFRCPGCGRLMDATALRPGERFKCAKCKKLMTFGQRLFDPSTRSSWQLTRTVLLVACVAATLWCVTVGYDFASRSGRWFMGFGGSLVVWLIAVGCIALAARASQNNGVLVGVTATMAGVALFFIERLGEEVDPATPGHAGALAEWRAAFPSLDWWAPALIVGGAVMLAVALVLQKRARSV